MSVIELAQTYPGTVLAAMLIGGVLGAMLALILSAFAHRNNPRIRVRFEDHVD